MVQQLRSYGNAFGGRQAHHTSPKRKRGFGSSPRLRFGIDQANRYCCHTLTSCDSIGSGPLGAGTLVSATARQPGRKCTDVLLWNRHRSPPPSRPGTPLVQAIPRWHELTPQIQANLLVQLTTLLLRHVGHTAPRGMEVDDDPSLNSGRATDPPKSPPAIWNAGSTSMSANPNPNRSNATANPHRSRPISSQRALDWGWPAERIRVLDGDQGRSGTSTVGRDDFAFLLSEVALGHVGLVMGFQINRLTREDETLCRLIKVCAAFDTLLADEDGLYHPLDFNDRIRLGRQRSGGRNRVA